MSLLNTTCPDLSELADALGPHCGIHSKKTQRSLCENIFDVQRGELFEVLERLRDAFWNDQTSFEPTTETPTTIIPPSPTLEQQNLKRTRSEPDQDTTYQQQEKQEDHSKKRIRKNTPEVKPITKPTYDLHAYASLWTLKQSLIQQIKSSSFKESELIASLKQIYKTKSIDQSRHLSLYLLPLAQAMKRPAVIQLLSEHQ